jgi:NAD+ kinase
MNKKLHFLKSGSPKSEEAFRVFTNKFNQEPLESCDVVVCLGGDGFLLQVLREYPNLKQPIFAMNRGTIGFLLNEFNEENLLERINNSQVVHLCPVRMEATNTAGETTQYRAFNEISVIRYSAQSANLSIQIDGKMALDHLSCDGVLVSTPAGSTAYNLSAHGPIIPLNANLLALTPVSPFRPRRWKGALLPNTSVVEIVNLDPVKRPIGAAADTQEVKDAVKIKVWQDQSEQRALLFDKDQSLEDRIMYEQFKS